MIRYEGPNAILTALSCLHNAWVFIYLLQARIWSLLHMRDMHSNITMAQGHAIPRHCDKLRGQTYTNKDLGWSDGWEYKVTSAPKEP